MTSTYSVSGMSCQHCVQAVTEEVSRIAGVTDVSVDLSTGTVTVASSKPISDTEVKAAVEEAGYELN